MLSKKEVAKRSVKDRRSSLDRRMIDFGPMYPNNNQRMTQDRRHGWGKRYDWKPINRWSSSPILFKNSDIQISTTERFRSW